MADKKREKREVDRTKHHEYTKHKERKDKYPVIETVPPPPPIKKEDKKK